MVGERAGQEGLGLGWGRNCILNEVGVGLVVGTSEQRRLEGDVGNKLLGAPAEFLLLSYMWFSTHKDLPSGDVWHCLEAL